MTEKLYNRGDEIDVDRFISDEEYRQCVKAVIAGIFPPYEIDSEPFVENLKKDPTTRQIINESVADEISKRSSK